jgi:hypothetical protein
VKGLKKRSQEIFLQESQEQTQMTHRTGEGLIMSSPAAPFMYRNITKRTGPLRPLPVLLQHDLLFTDLHAWQSAILRAFCDRMVQLDSSCYVPELQIPKQISEMNGTESNNEISSPSQQQRKNSVDSLNQWSQMVKRLIKDIEKQKSKAHMLQQIQNLKKQNLIMATTSQSEDQDLFEAYLRNTDRNSTTSDSSEVTETIFQQQAASYMPSHNEIMETITYNVIIGNQLIIRSNDIHLANDICNLYMKLVPEESVRAALNSSIVKMSYEANFVTIDQSAAIPDEIDFNNAVLLDITFNYDPGTQQSRLLFLSMLYEGQVLETVLGSQIKQLYTKSSLRYKQTKDAAVDRKNLERVKTLEASMIRVLREEWVAKAKLLVQGVRSTHHSDLMINRLLQMIHLTTDDLPVLQNFSTGLWKKSS